jgi:hypothetical protein
MLMQYQRLLTLLYIGTFYFIHSQVVSLIPLLRMLNFLF